MTFILSIALISMMLYLLVDSWKHSTIRIERSDRYITGAIVVVATTARAIFLGESSLEHLEVSYLFEAIKPDSYWGVLTSRQSAEQMHQPLYPILMRGWASLSINESFLRIPSLLFSIACIPATWLMLRGELDRFSAHIGAGLVASAPLMVWYGRDCSPYAVFAYLALCAIISAQQSITQKSKHAALRAGIALSLCFYAHFHGAWVCVTTGLWLLWYFRKGFWHTTATTAVLCLPWVGVMLDKLATSVQGLSEDKPIMRYSHDLSEAIPEGLRVLAGGEYFTWILSLAAVLLGTARLLQRKQKLGSLLVIALVVAFIAELHILWQLKQSKGIIYVDVRHYIYLVPLIMAAVSALPWRRIAALVIGFQLSTALPMIMTTEKPDVRRATAYIKKHSGPAHGVAILPAPWYHPIVEYYMFGICPNLVHARSYDGWWNLSNCELEESPQKNSIFGFPGTSNRIYQNAQRTQLDYFWVIDIRDHRFGLPVAPTEPQEQFLCWSERSQAQIMSKSFGDGVILNLFDAKRLRMIGKPPALNDGLETTTVTATEAWQLNCNVATP